MKKLVAIMAVVSSTSAFAFTEDFEGTLGQWTGKNNGSHSGQVVTDPISGSTNDVLNFTGTNSGGDIYTLATFQPGTYRLEFDYLGTCGSQDCGGFIGYSQNYDPASDGIYDDLRWLASSWPAGFFPTSQGDIVVDLTDNGSWGHYSTEFTVSSYPFHLMLEDYRGLYQSPASWSMDAGGSPGDAYFDNITLTAVPLPAPVWLLGPALMLLLRKRRQTA
jgi:hypothetical protein